MVDTFQKGSIGLNKVDDDILVVLPSVFPHFFIGATVGVISNKLGGLKALVISSIIAGVVIGLVPIIYMAAGLYSQYENVANGQIWTDPDYLLYVPFLLLLKLSYGSYILLGVSLLMVAMLFIETKIRKMKTLRKTVKN